METSKEEEPKAKVPKTENVEKFKRTCKKIYIGLARFSDTKYVQVPEIEEGGIRMFENVALETSIEELKNMATRVFFPEGNVPEGNLNLLNKALKPIVECKNVDDLIKTYHYKVQKFYLGLNSETDTEGTSMNGSESSIIKGNGTEVDGTEHDFIFFEWLHWDKKTNKWNEVEKIDGGGKRKIFISPEDTKSTLLEKLEKAYFPDAESPKGNLWEFDRDVRDCGRKSLKWSPLIANVLKERGYIDVPTFFFTTVERSKIEGKLFLRNPDIFQESYRI